MSNYSALKTAIQQAVYTNGNNEITGAGLQSVLLQIVNTVGDGYVFKGVATTGTSAGTPDANVFYIAPAGTYTNFGSSYTVPVGSVGVFKYNGSWTKEQIALFAGIDDVPTADSDNLVKSGGVAKSVIPLQHKVDGIRIEANFDISTKAGRYTIGNYTLFAGEEITLKTTGTCNITRYWIENENHERLIDYVAHVSNSETEQTFVIPARASVSTVLSLYVSTATIAGTLSLEISKKGVNEEILSLYNTVDEINMIVDVTKNIGSGGTIDIQNLHIAASELFAIKINLGNIVASRVVIFAYNTSVQTKIYDVNSPNLDNYIFINPAFDVNRLLFYIYSTAQGNFDANAVVYKHSFAMLLQEQEKYANYGVVENSILGKTISGSVTFTSSRQIKLGDISIPKGYRYTVMLSSPSSWDRMGIDSQNGWGQIDYHDYLPNGQMVSYTAADVITELNAYCISAQTYPLTVSYEVSIISASEIVNAIPRLCIPNKMYILKNSQNSVYHKNIFDWLDGRFIIKNNSSAWSFLERCCRSLALTAAYTISLCDRYSQNELYHSIGSATIIGDPTTDNGLKKINVIGDSFTYNGMWYQQIYNLCPNLSFVGMRKSYNTQQPLRAEGRGGWTLNDYLTRDHYNDVFSGFSPFIHPAGYKYYGVTGFWAMIVNGAIGEYGYSMDGFDDYITWFGTDGKKLNPVNGDMMYDSANNSYIYYNGTSWATYNGTPTFVFDYSKYIEVWNIQNPDFVIIMLGVNDFYNSYSESKAEQFVQNYNNVLDSIKSFSSNVKVAICTNTVIAGLPNSTAGVLQNVDFASRNLWNGRKLIIDTFNNATYEGRGIYVVDTGAVLDPDYGFNVTEIKPFDYYEGDEREIYDTNGVHPSDAGYKQIGTCAAGFIQSQR